MQMSKSMKFFRIFAILSLFFAYQSQAQATDGLLAAANEAYTKQDLVKLKAYAQQLQAKGDILAPYAEYWIMLLQLSTSSNQVVQDFLQRYDAYPFADRVRGEWLKKLGKRSEERRVGKEWRSRRWVAQRRRHKIGKVIFVWSRVR